MSLSVAPCLPAWEPPRRPILKICEPKLTPPQRSRQADAHSASAPAEPALRQILIGMIPALRRRALRWCRDAAEAEDLTQETLLRGLAQGAELGSEQHVRAWLYTVLRNLFISRRRRQRIAASAKTRLQGSLESSAPGATPFLTSSVERAIQALPAVFADVVILVDLEDHSYADAARALDIPVGTVMSRLSRGRERLAAALAERR